ncbi:MAG: retron St85 family RNA-directed DNA polymerase [Clostridia bacterium]|nr:retron St85 family RNA-directed DNA polymerase [Clostridia bacterium]
MIKEYINKTFIESLDLPMMKSFDDLVQNLRLSAKLMHWLTSSSSGKYKTFYLIKKDGSKRRIDAPARSLKIVQRWILDNILAKIKVSPYSFGFKSGEKGSPLVKCAEKHKNNLYILKVDLKNFYPSINKERVYYTFLDLGYNSSVANLLTDICVRDGYLPQGAVTSAYLANLICRDLDYRVAGYCNKRDIIYTRYADDLTFSCDNRETLHKSLFTIRRIIEGEKFQLNTNKIHFMTPKCKKSILGITLNDTSIKAPREMKRMVRSVIHYQVATGDYTDNDKIRGYISYINSIEETYKDQVLSYIQKLAESQLCLFEELVDAFNKNKLYQELPDMILRDAGDFVNAYEEDEFMTAVYYEHREFLIKYGLLEEETDTSNLEEIPF